jgi:anti-anti-sigma regulatory factor
LLLELREFTQAKGIEFKLVNVPQLVQHVSEITCLNTVFKISSEGDALSAASRLSAQGVAEIRIPLSS